MNLVSRDYQEKRNFIRMRVDTPVSIDVKNGDETLSGKCHDLSGGGLQVELGTVLPVGTEVEVSIASSHGHNPMLHANAIVTRVVSQPESESQPCLLGLEIKEMLN